MFTDWCDPNDVSKWSKIRIGRELPLFYPKARSRKDGQFFIGNIAWKEQVDLAPDSFKPGIRLTVKGDYLESII
jgi:hypothetical protein